MARKQQIVSITLFPRMSTWLHRKPTFRPSNFPSSALYMRALLLVFSQAFFVARLFSDARCPIIAARMSRPLKLRDLITNKRPIVVVPTNNNITVVAAAAGDDDDDQVTDNEEVDSHTREAIRI